MPVATEDPGPPALNPLATVVRAETAVMRVLRVRAVPEGAVLAVQALPAVLVAMSLVSPVMVALAVQVGRIPTPGESVVRVALVAQAVTAATVVPVVPVVLAATVRPVSPAVR